MEDTKLSIELIVLDVFVDFCGLGYWGVLELEEFKINDEVLGFWVDEEEYMVVERWSR